MNEYYSLDNSLGFGGTYPMDIEFLRCTALSNLWTTGAWGLFLGSTENFSGPKSNS